MSHLLYWPGRMYFYPLGNTSAVCLTESLPPEHNADVLLLGCGDPRHILYTVYADATRSAAGPRKIDVTCCDIEAAVLARNTLLFTLLADNGAEKRLSDIWNIFYHMMIDQDSLSLLIEQCRKLVPLAQDMETWKQGPYAHIVAMCDDATLFDIQRFWKLWLGTADFNAQQTKHFAENFQDELKNVRARNKGCFMMTSMRSAGPLARITGLAATDQFETFWTSGVTDDGIQVAKPAKNVNPTFAFSASGDKFSVHYATDPLLGFHLAETLASSGYAISDDETPAIVFKMVQAARHQFNAWCKAVIGRIQHKSASSASLVVRMYAGEALAFCQALHSICISPQPHTPTFVAPWKRSVVRLDKTAYGLHALSPAPTSFNVIETSNLLDHLGLYNLLILTVPLLRSSPSSTLYTEALLTLGKSATNGILTHMCGDPSTISLFLGVIPSGYVSRFTTRSNMADVLLHDILDGAKAQYHERLAWKPVDPECTVEHSWKKSIQFAPEQLTKTLFEIYLQMFSDENISQLAMSHLSEEGKPRRVQSSGLQLLHYTPHSFAQFLAHIRERVLCDWDNVIYILEGLVLGDETGSDFYYQELVCQLHLAGFTLPWLSPAKMQELRVQEDPPVFRDWSTVPQVVTVALVVPRHAFSEVQSELTGFRTAIMQCEMRAAFGYNAFACTSGSFGELQISGRGENKTAVFMEDNAGVHGTSPMVLSFPVLATTLIHSSGGTVGLAFRSTRSSMPLVKILGFELSLFNAPLTDERHVHVLAKAPTTSHAAADDAAPPVPIGRSDDAIEHNPIYVEMGASNTRVLSLTAHVNITDAEEQVSFGGGCAVRTTQLSANHVILYVESYQHTVAFPLPVDALNARIRVARKSKYVEIVAPMTFTLDVKGQRDIAKNFRMTIDNGIPILWDVHNLNLDRCPPFKPSKDPKAFNWFVPHVSYMFSHRECVARYNRKVVPGVARDTFLNVKGSLHTLFYAATGLAGQTHTEFGLWNPTTEDIYTIILVTDLRLDLAAHTIVADSWVIPVLDNVRARLIGEVNTMLSLRTDADESEAWRHLLPLFIERCRTWEHKSNCEYLAQNSAPLYPGAGADPNKVPYCLCGMGVGTEVLRRRYGSGAATYATRAAISPLFFVPYLEKAGTTYGSAPSAKAPTQVGCRTCGKAGKALSVCSRCKRVKYCSKECQVQDWKRHKKDCT